VQGTTSFRHPVGLVGIIARRWDSARLTLCVQVGNLALRELLQRSDLTVWEVSAQKPLGIEAALSQGSSTVLAEANAMPRPGSLKSHSTLDFLGDHLRSPENRPERTLDERPEFAGTHSLPEGRNVQDAAAFVSRQRNEGVAIRLRAECSSQFESIDLP
jgi:hypothetical protein